VPTLSVLVRAALVVACIAGAVGSFIAYRSQRETGLALVTMLRGGGDESTLRQLEDADTPLYPDSVRDSTKAIVLARLGRGAEGERLLFDAIEREPENQILWITLARVQATLGKRDEARASQARAVALNSQTPAGDVPPPIEPLRP
jgi:Flp pilus assembly protein TadD